MDLRASLARQPRTPLATLPAPLHRLARLTRELGGPELWVKRDDLTGLAGGGNKTRKLEYLVGDALQRGADTLVTVGAIQSNHTRQTAAAAARAGLKCVLLHNGWTTDPGPSYRRAGNLLISDLVGARLLLDDTRRPVGNDGQLAELVDQLRADGHRPYAIPVGGSDHPLGGLGYAALDVPTRVIGCSDDDEATAKQQRVLRLANATSTTLGLPPSTTHADVEVIVAENSPYGAITAPILTAMRRFARTEGLLADPVYEGRTILGLTKLIEAGRLKPGDRVLVLHMGGCPAVHAYAEHVRSQELTALPGS